MFQNGTVYCRADWYSDFVNQQAVVTSQLATKVAIGVYRQLSGYGINDQGNAFAFGADSTSVILPAGKQVDIACFFQCCFLAADGSVSCPDASLPSLPDSIAFRQIVVGSDFLCGLRVSGGFTCVGASGDPDFNRFAFPFTELSSISMVSDCSCGLVASSDTLVCWTPSDTPSLPRQRFSAVRF